MCGVDQRRLHVYPVAMCVNTSVLELFYYLHVNVNEMNSTRS
jgi:hypothetical protein